MNDKDQPERTTSMASGIAMGAADVWDIMGDAYRNYKHNGDINQAAAIALYAILSLIPLFLLTLLAAGYLFSSQPQIQTDISENIRAIHPFFPEDLPNNLVRLKENNSVLGWLGIASLIWLSAMIFSALEKALNIIFRTRTYRNFIASKLMALSMIPLGWFVGIVSVGITYVATIMGKQMLFIKGIYSFQAPILILHYLLSFLLVVVFVTLLYRIVPKTRISFRGAVGGAVIFATLLEAAKYFFTWYITNYAHYDLIFGSMEAVVLLVMWVFYVAIIMLFCAEIISSYERRNLILLEKAFLKPKNTRLMTFERLLSKFGKIYQPGAYLFQEGDKGRDIFYILAGKVCIEKKSAQVTKTLAEIGTGSYLGEMAALLNEPRTASARSITTSHVAVISETIFRNLLRESEAVSLFMLQEFSRRIKHTSEELERVTHAWIKLLVVLYFIKEWPLPEGKDPITELSDITEKTKEEIAEIILWLSKEGILHIRKGRVIIFDKDSAWNLLNFQVC